MRGGGRQSFRVWGAVGVGGGGGREASKGPSLAGQSSLEQSSHPLRDHGRGA